MAGILAGILYNVVPIIVGFVCKIIIMILSKITQRIVRSFIMICVRYLSAIKNVSEGVIHFSGSSGSDTGLFLSGMQLGAVSIPKADFKDFPLEFHHGELFLC